MFKKFLGVIFFSTFLLLISISVSAQNSTLEPVDCFSPGLYQFQSVQVSVGPEKDTYSAGDNINFVGSVVNENEYPVVDGTVFVRISKDNKNYITEGYNVVDEIIATSSFSIDASLSLPVNFSWSIPKGIESGDYSADYFFSVGNKFNLGGLPFTNEIVVGSAEFKIIGTKNSEFTLDRAGTEVNDEEYMHVGDWPFVQKDSEIKITQPIKNLTSKEIKATINYDLYFWDSLNAKDKLGSKTETITIPANSSKDLTYLISKSEQSVYYLRIKATVGDVSSIVNIRTTSDIEKARINYPAITTFPLLKGESTNLFSCFHTVYGVASSSKLILTLTDKAGANVAKGEYNGSFADDMSAASMKFTSDKDYYFLNLKAELFDDKGKIVDSYQTKYDCATLNSDKCQGIISGTTNSGIVFFMVTIILIVLMLVLFFIAKSIENSNHKKITNISLVLLSILFVIFLSLTIYSLIVSNVIAGAVAYRDGGRTAIQTSGLDFSLRVKNSKGGTAKLASGFLNLTNTITADKTALIVGDTVSFGQSTGCTFNSTGGTFDTPYCETYQKYKGTGGAYTEFTWSNPTTPTLSLISSNNNVLSCSGVTCRAIGSGVVTVTASTSQFTSLLDLGLWSATKHEKGEVLQMYCLHDGGTFRGNDCPTNSSDAFTFGILNKSIDGVKNDYNKSPDGTTYNYSVPHKLVYQPSLAYFRINIAPVPTCTDGIRNGTETGIDCGGSCANACVALPTCTDGIRNGTETGIDCGGSCLACPVIPACGNGIIDTGEVCDSSNLNGATCSSVSSNFTGGVLSCSSSCSSYNTSSCTGPGGCVGNACNSGGGLNANCIGPGGISITNGRSYTYYQNPTVTSPVTCVSQSESRTCTNGNLDGSYTNPTCSQNAAGSTGSCTITKTNPTSNATLNHTTIWTANSSCTPNCKYVWSGSNLPEGGTPPVGINTLSKIYTTIGLKNIFVNVLNADGSEYCNSPATATTTVIQGDSDTIEQ